MKHLFVPYELAKKLKEKGFDGPCLAQYHEPGSGDVWDFFIIPTYDSINVPQIASAPLYQQVVDWFRDTKGIEISVFSILPNVFGYSFEFAAAYKEYPRKSNGQNSYSLHVVDQVLYMEKIGYNPIPNSAFEKSKYTYYEALTRAIEEAIKLI